jgi:phospho-N-acetylmuramoyl-pentapeptide-transferase
MFYYLAFLWRDEFSALNVLTYNTMRTGAAALTGFLFCLLLGPMLINHLRMLKIGQYIKKEHVADLHALHKGKSGTPTMGGTLIISATLLTLLLWADWSNRLLLMSVFMLCMMGGVGFVDDYIKLRRKHNDGLSAKAKMIGQIVAGGVLGVFLLLNPITTGAGPLTARDVVDWRGLTAALAMQANGDPADPECRIYEHLSPAFQEELTRVNPQHAASEREFQRRMLEELNNVMVQPELYAAAHWEGRINGEAKGLIGKDISALARADLVRLNRLLVESAFPNYVARSVRDLHTKLEIPGLRDRFISLGVFYVLFVIVIIMATSNAVNLTDGLDGLAIGSAIMSILAYTAIAYVVSRADWSRYLFLIYVPEATELAVFGGALLGTGMGFLWFNCHPAEVFMGDTGSLSLGAVIGTMAILTKQELLLIVVAGLFVLEALSVLIQVGSFKLTGKRVFRMAPLHHHFELKGWSESKVTIRFWILSLLFALLSLSALKLR